jgi:hypothetical protein
VSGTMTGKPPELTRIFDIIETGVDAATTFESRRVKHLYDWWASANGGRMPTRRMFDVLDHRPIVANLFVADVLPNGEFKFRLFGEEVIRIVGRNRKGETVKKVDAGEYGHELYTYYRTIVENRACRKCNGSLKFAIGGARRFESIDCPLADDSGEGIITIIGVMDVVKQVS